MLASLKRDLLSLYVRNVLTRAIVEYTCQASIDFEPEIVLNMHIKCGVTPDDIASEHTTWYIQNFVHTELV